MRNRRMVLALLALATAACGGDGGLATDEEVPMVSLTSPAFADGEPIPAKYTADGDDVSPPLAVGEIPAGVKELALIVDDPDAPMAEPWVHWVVYGIDPATREIPADWDPEVAGAIPGRNSWAEGRNIGWGGPSPPRGTGVHRYVFQLYALDTPLDLAPGATKEKLLAAMKGHVLAEGRLIGTYTRD